MTDDPVAVDLFCGAGGFSVEFEEAGFNNHECRGHNMRDLMLYKLLGEGVGWVIEDIDEEYQPYHTDIFSDNYRKQKPDEPASTVLAQSRRTGTSISIPARHGP